MTADLKQRRLAPPTLPLLQLPLLVVLVGALSQYAEALPSWFTPPDECESTHQPTPYTGAVPPLPTLPRQYSLRVEANILRKRWTTEVEEHYDNINQRASLAVTFNGSTIYSIFNFRSGERYDIYPNGSCMASPAQVDYYGIVRMAGPKGQRPAMATINEVFKFGNGFNQTYVGKSVVRGIPVNHWTSCRQWERWGAKFQLDFYFADPDFISASGGVEVPVRIVLNGSANNVGMRHQAVEGRHIFEHVYEFVSVRPGPPQNEDVFLVPVGVICEGRQDTKPMPELPDRFEMNTEIVVPEVGMPPRQNYMRYDWPHRLLETGMRMTVPQGVGPGTMKEKMKSKFPGGAAGGGGGGGGGGGASGSGPAPHTAAAGGGNSDGMSMMNGGGGGNDDDDDNSKLRLMSISTVQDFNTGIVYVLDKMNMTCSAHMMPQSTRELGMSHGANLFHPLTRQSNSPSGFTYQGQTHLRRMLVDVWAMEENGITQELYFLAERDRSMMRPPSSPMQPGQQQQQQDIKPLPTYNRKPYPSLVGMYIKNSTANRDASMAAIFQEVFRPNAMEWTGLGTTPKPASSSPFRPPWGETLGDQVAFGLQLERRLEQRLSHKLVHIYNYQPMHTESSNFQVSMCYPDDQVSQVMVVVRTSYDEDVLQSFAAFSNNLRQAIASNAGVSLLQVSNLMPMPMGQMGANITTVTFSLLGKPIPTVSGQLGLGEAKRKLQAAIQRGVTFTVEYTQQSKSFIVDKDHFLFDYDAAGFKTPTHQGTGDWGSRPGGKGNRQAGLGQATDEQGGGKGYSGGALAGVGVAMLALGLMGGLGIAYLLYKKRARLSCNVPYQMTS